MMTDVIDSLLQAVDGRRALRVERVRASIARKLLSRSILPRVCELLGQIHALRCEDDRQWETIVVLLHDLRDVFVHSRIPAAVIHREFGRLCAAVCDGLSVLNTHPERWAAIRQPCQRHKALRLLMRRVGCALEAVDLTGLLGPWAQQQVGLVARVVGG